MNGLDGLFAGLGANLWVTLIVFVVVAIGAIHILSGGQLMQALGGLLRVVASFFTTPFVFLRDALSVLLNANVVEKDYARSRTFMLYRYSRLQYFGILALSLLVLSSGITASLMSLWPQAELEQQKQYSEQIKQLRTDIKEAEAQVEAAGKPEFRAGLQKASEDLKAKYEAQRRSNQQFLQSANDPTGAIYQVQSTNSPEALETIKQRFDALIAECPNGYQFSGMTPEMCSQIKIVVADAAARRGEELNLRTQAQEAERAFSEAELAGEQAAANLEILQSNLSSTQEARNAVSLFNPGVIVGKLGGAIGILIGTAMGVIFIVWLGAILIDILNWIILMMRVLEKDAISKMPNAASEYEPGGLRPREQDEV
jgi:hypothetical protein